MSAPKLLNNVKFLQKCIIVNDKGKILALRRDPSDKRRANCWDLPGGNFEEGEEVSAMMRREIKEETGINAKSFRPIHLANSIGKTYENITVFAVCQVSSDWTGEVTLSNEHVEYRWVTTQEFMDLETGDDGGFLKASVRAYISTLHK